MLTQKTEPIGSVFCVHSAITLDGPSSADEVHDDGNYSKDQQQMDEETADMQNEKSPKPKNNQHNSQYEKHERPLSRARVRARRIQRIRGEIGANRCLAPVRTDSRPRTKEVCWACGSARQRQRRNTGALHCGRDDRFWMRERRTDNSRSLRMANKGTGDSNEKARATTTEKTLQQRYR
jgi:hypothetical protein